MHRIIIIVFLSLIACLYAKAGDQLDIYHSDKKNDWKNYIAGDQLYLSGKLEEAIKKWKKSASNGNLHAAARLFQEDFLNKTNTYQKFYESLASSKFAIGQYLNLRFNSSKITEKEEALKKEIVKSMFELEGTDDYWAMSIVGNFFADNFLNKNEFLVGVRFLLKAAEGGYSPAQDKLGMMYWEGSAVFNKDLNKAKLWLEKAASIKDKYACLHLAQIYHKGSDDIPPEIPKSIPFYEEAARQGLTDAILNLGLIYEEGQGIAKDPEKAHHFLSQLLDSEDMEIYRFLGTRYFYTDKEWKDKKKGLLWYEKAAEVGSIVEKYKYADFYYSDKDVRDYKKALSLFLDLVPKDGVINHQFHILVYLRLGAIYFNGFGVKQDYLESKKYYEKVDHTSEALEAIIFMYLNGWGVKQSDDMVIAYIDKLMDPTRAKGFEPGPYFRILGNIYKKRQDISKSLLNYRLGALSNDEGSMEELIKIYTPLDSEKAGDLGDICLSLLKFEEAEAYYQKEVSKNNLRNRYNSIRIQNIEKSKNYNSSKSFIDMKKFAEEDFSNYSEKLDHKIIDRVIDPELVDIPLKARAYHWLSIQSKRKIDSSELKEKSYEECAEYFLQAEKHGCWFGGLNAALVLIKNDNPKNWLKGKEILDRLYKEKNAFAAAMLSGYHSILRFGSTDFQKAQTYKTDAINWDNQALWHNTSIDTLVKKGVGQLILPTVEKK